MQQVSLTKSNHSARLITWHTRLHNSICPAGDFIHLWLHCFLSLPLILYGCPKLSNMLFWGERQWNRACGKRETGGKVTMTIHPQPWITNTLRPSQQNTQEWHSRERLPGTLSYSVFASRITKVVNLGDALYFHSRTFREKLSVVNHWNHFYWILSLQTPSYKTTINW